MDPHGFGTGQTLAGLCPFPCLWDQTGSEDVVGEGVVFLQVQNTLDTGLDLFQGSLDTPDLWQQKEVPQ